MDSHYDYIMERITAHYNKLQEVGIPNDQIMCIAAYGSMNYNMFKPGVSDVDTKAIYVPSYEEAVFEKRISREYHVGNDEHCELKDIREMANMWRKQNINFVEILFTPYILINPLYIDEWRSFAHLRESIAHYDEKKTHLSVGSQAANTLRQMRNKGYDGKKYANALRLAYFFHCYHLEGFPYWDCINLPEEKAKQLMEIKYSDDPEVGFSYYDPELLEENLELYRSLDVPGPRPEVSRLIRSIECRTLKAGEMWTEMREKV